MGKKLNKLLFDKRDHALIRIVNDALSAGRQGRFARKVYFPYLHPHGIKEMTETKGLRSAYAERKPLVSDISLIPRACARPTPWPSCSVHWRSAE